MKNVSKIFVELMWKIFMCYCFRYLRVLMELISFGAGEGGSLIQAFEVFHRQLHSL